MHLITKFCDKGNSIYPFYEYGNCSQQKDQIANWWNSVFTPFSPSSYRPEISNSEIVSNQAMISIFHFQISANFSDSRYRPWPRVKQFLMDLEPGAFVCDVGQSSKFFSFFHRIFLSNLRCWSVFKIRFN